MGTELDRTDNGNMLDIAVIGMSCVFPEAENTEQFWENLCNGVETVKFFTDEELLARGVSQEELKSPDYVKAASVLGDIGLFDAEFFGINPNEARSMDPQHRIFLECCWEALENAGYDPEAYGGDIGLFAGVAMNSYIPEVLAGNADFLKSVSSEQLMIGNDKDFLPTLVSYKLNLKGPSVNVNTACSTSLVAIHLARQSLLLGECDMVLAGGVSIFISNGRGYMYKKDGIQSPDGHCRAFDANAKGTIWGDGCGVVVLKRLADAIRDGDHIYAVLKGSAVNNDGSQKVGYTAPSVEGQSKVIVEALTVAGVSPEQINYVETHGTGTQLGDPIEIAALTQAFQSGTGKKGYCPVGSVKTNIGHLNSAAGVAGFIKTVLAIKNKKLPSSINFEMSNPKIDFENSPFYVNTRLADWKKGMEPLRAGISSMGIGGTNSHVIIEEAPRIPKKEHGNVSSGEYLLILSARSSKALEDATDNLADYLEAHDELSLEDVAFTLQCGRRTFSHRRALRCRSVKEAVNILRTRDMAFLYDGKSFKDVGKTPLDGSMLERWLNGENMDWSVLWENLSPRRVPLPSYPFERKRFWVEPKTPNIPLKNSTSDEDQYYKKLDDMADWFYLPIWKNSTLPFTAKKRSNKSRLVFADDFLIGDSVSRKLKEEGDTIITAWVGENYKQRGESEFILNPSDPGDYLQMLRALQDSGKLPDSILFFWSLEPVNETKLDFDLDSLVATQERGFFSILNLTKALDELGVRKPVEFIAFTNNLFDILGSEELCINASTVPGMFLVMQQAYENFACRVIDILIPEAGSVQYQKTVEALIDEITHDTSETVCAYRGTKRYVRRYDPVRVEADAPRGNEIRKNGVYLAFSGLEGIGHLVSQHIAKNIGAKVLILEEEGFPARENWGKWIEEVGEEHPVSFRIKNAARLLENNAEYIGTISDLKENQGLLDELEKRFGKINGIIHAPGASNAKRVRTIKSSSPETWYEHFKVVSYSLMILDRIFKNKDLDFRIMLNSLGSVLGGSGFINIATVSNYIKAYITMQSRTDKQPWAVQCWDSWLVEWGQIGKFFPQAMYKRVEPSILTNEEGIKCFERTFAVRNTIELAISGTDLSNRYHRWVKLNSLNKPEIGENVTDLMPRPNLDTAYVAPRNAIEQTLEGIFSELLGIKEIGVNDNFFDLGGHSLLGVQLVSKLRNIYPVDMDLYRFIANPTIVCLAAYLEPLEKTQSA